MNTHFTYFTIVTFFLFTINLQAQACDHPDYESLSRLYETTDGPNWRQQEGWLSDCEPCGWWGVGCDANDRVTSLTLRGNRLDGTLPTEIGGLTFLRYLHIGYNTVSGSLPAEVFELDSLRTIYVGGNQLNGELPATFAAATQLEWVVLYKNEFTGELPGSMADFTSLEVINVSDNQFTGAIPVGLGDLPNITGVHLENNDFTGCFPEDLAGGCDVITVRTGGNTELPWYGNYNAFCDANLLEEEQTGAPCNDGDDSTIGDRINTECGCTGTLGLDGRESGFNPDDDTDERNNASRKHTDGLISRRTITPTGPGRTFTPATTITATESLLAYPNPLTGNRLNVELPADVTSAKLRLLSLHGQVITMTTAGQSRTTLEVPTLVSGVYLLEATVDGARILRRIVVR